jgi:hypothetical protein
MPRRSSPRADELRTLVGGGVVRVDHLVELGLTRSTIAHRCRPDGPWSRLAPGVVKLDNGPVTRADRRRAALLHAGAGAVLTGLDALELHGMRRMPAPAGPVHVLIPEERRRGGAGLALVERTERVPSTWNAKLYDRYGRFVAMPDAWFDDVRMAWEIDSRELHLSPADHERTLERHAAMTAEGIVVLHTLPKMLRHRAAATEELRRTHATAAQRPRPQVNAIPEG